MEVLMPSAVEEVEPVVDVLDRVAVDEVEQESSRADGRYPRDV
jgi:hypothetical protein